MKEIILEFLEWVPDGVDDIFELLDKPNEVTEKFLRERDK